MSKLSTIRTLSSSYRGDHHAVLSISTDNSTAFPLYAAPFSRPHLSVGCKQPAWPHDASPAMTTPREQRPNDTVELLPLKSALVNNNYKDDDAYYPPPLNNNPSSSNLYDYTMLSKRTPASKRYFCLFFFVISVGCFLC